MENDESLLPPGYKNLIDETAKAHLLEDYETHVSQATEKGDNHLGNLLRINLVAKGDSDTRKRMDLILKLSPECPRLREHFPLKDSYYREVNAYQVLFPQMNKLQRDYIISEEDKFKFVKCYSVSTVLHEEYLLLEDLGAQGFKMADRFRPMDLDHTKLALTELAKFHSLSFALREQNPKLFAELAEKTTETEGIVENYGQFIRNKINEVREFITNREHLEKYVAFGNEIEENVVKWANPKTTEPFNVICHGDCWINNFLFKYKDGRPVDIRLVDFQAMRHTSPVVDTSYALFTGTEQKFRDKYYNYLLRFYYDRLKRSFANLGLKIRPIYPRRVFSRHMNTMSQSGLGVAVCCIPTVLSAKSDPIDMGLVFEGTSEGRVKYSKECKERIKGVVEFFVVNDLI